MASEKVLRVKVPELGKLSVQNAAKLTGQVGGLLAMQQWLVAQGILPGSIMKGNKA